MLGDYLIKDGVLLEPAITKKWHVLEALTRFYCRDVPETVADLIFETVLNRELRVSTGLGGGVAIPHARTDLVDRTGVLFVRFKNGIEWESIDGSLVHFLFVVIGPTSSADEYLLVLSKISKILSLKSNRAILLSSDTHHEVRKILVGIGKQPVSPILEKLPIPPPSRTCF
jgi:mannitol/fructose-specific phosphotransferase system IIA component (Ntr-type)